jgi:hypothetical protein
LFRNERPQFIDINNWRKLSVFIQAEMSHSFLSEVAGMILIEQNSVMVLTTGITSTGRMFSVLANTTVAVGYVSSHLSGLFQTGSLTFKQLPL